MAYDRHEDDKQVALAFMREELDNMITGRRAIFSDVPLLMNDPIYRSLVRFRNKVEKAHQAQWVKVYGEG